MNIVYEMTDRGIALPGVVSWEMGRELHKQNPSKKYDLNYFTKLYITDDRVCHAELSMNILPKKLMGKRKTKIVTGEVMLSDEAWADLQDWFAIEEERERSKAAILAIRTRMKERLERTRATFQKQ